MPVTKLIQPVEPFCCNLCTSAVARDLFTVRGFRIVKCHECGLIAVANPPAPSDLAAYYDEGYYSGGNELVYKDYLGFAAARKIGFTARLHNLMRFFDAPGKLIEIGAAYGLFLGVAQEEGWKVLGVELSPVSSAYARERLGLDIITGDLDSVPARDSYDLAVGWDVIEHLSDPIGTLKQLNTHLRMGGIVALSTGNAACMGARLYGAKWHLFAPPWHLYFFTSQTLKMMLEKAGLHVISVTYGGNPFYNHPIQSIWDRVLIRGFCNRLADRFVQKAAYLLGQGLMFTVYASKVRDLADEQ
jgi:SAM-dependent methyltransferase